MNNKETQVSMTRWLVRWELWHNLYKHFLDLIKEEAEEEAGCGGEYNGEYEEGEDEEQGSETDNDLGNNARIVVGRKRTHTRTEQYHKEEIKVKDWGEEWDKVLIANIDLLSRWGLVLCRTNAGEQCKKVEQELQQCQAEDPLDDLQAYLITIYALHQQTARVLGANKQAQVCERVKQKQHVVKVAAAMY